MSHKDISTTMKYLHFVEGHARRSFEVAERLERAELVRAAGIVVGDV